MAALDCRDERSDPGVICWAAETSQHVVAGACRGREVYSEYGPFISMSTLSFARNSETLSRLPSAQAFQRGETIVGEVLAKGWGGVTGMSGMNEERERKR